ncbi:MAG: hypothetical protein M9962_08130 [Oligoflexia bacterium]|nr:hypothetical protein [Oligoflexia bacterium]
MSRKGNLEFSSPRKGPIAKNDSLAIRSHKGKNYWLTGGGVYVVENQSIHLTEWIRFDEANSFAFDRFDQVHFSSPSGLVRAPDKRLTEETSVYDVYALPDSLVFSDKRGIVLANQKGEISRVTCEDEMRVLNLVSENQWMYLKQGELKICDNGNIREINLPEQRPVVAYTFIHGLVPEEHQVAIAFEKQSFVFVYKWKDLEALLK